jgi:hypothetical protein
MNMDILHLNALLVAKMRPNEVNSILDYLTEHHADTSAESVQVAMINPFATEIYKHSTWPVLTWREDGNVDVMAIFKVRREGEPCSVLLHYGIQGEFDINYGRRGWEDEVVGWYVREINDIPELFVASWQIGKGDRGHSSTDERRDGGKEDIRVETGL